MAPILHFHKKQGGKKFSFLVKTWSEKVLEEAVEKIECFCLVVIKGLMK